MNSFEYSQVYAILLMLGNSYIEKIPDSIINDIILKMDKNNIPKYDINTIDENIEISRNVYDCISLFYLKYWS